MSQTIERPRVSGPGSGLGGGWRVIVLNDDHNTFDHVAVSLARYVPGISIPQG
jgi:ATP-dependent Clp protease adaptor protein ClpS